MTTLSILAQAINVAIVGSTAGVLAAPQSPVNLTAVIGPQNIAVQLVGTQGPAGVSGSGTKQYLAAENIGGQKAVYQSSTGLRVASVASRASSEVIGITTGAVSIGALANVQTQDEITEVTWLWVQGQPVWLGVDGSLTQSISANTVQVEVGVAVSPTKILVNVQPPMHLI